MDATGIKSKVAVYVDDQGGHWYDARVVQGTDRMTDVQRQQVYRIIDDVVRVERSCLRNRRAPVKASVSISNPNPKLLLCVSLVIRRQN